MARNIGDLQQLVMLAIARLGDGAYGGSVRDELERVGQRSVSVSTVYVTMVRLEADGLVASRREAGGPDAHGGRRRRFFALTAEGKRTLVASRQSFARMWDGLELEG
ncbi:MAG: PadR family transcriptional regulator [Acidobacteria bacterium]|nr:PadR family transcriptional regulator [Acidobacteriota bacterium]